jgi:membrane-bound lytic murein transglycosylase D
MPAFARLPAPLAPLAFATLAILSFDADALSRRDQAAVDALNQRMQTAETRYRDALVDARNAGPDAQKAADAALEDMEDVIMACGKQRGCSVPTMLTAFKRLLKADVDASATGEDADSTLVDETPDAGSVPDSAEAAALLTSEGERFKRMVQYNPAVQAGIRRWLTDMRVSLIQSHENYQYMRQLMSPGFERHGLPEALLFGIMAKESNGKVHVGSRAGAVGPMQFMPATGRRFGLGPDGSGFDTRYDPRLAADAAARYLNERFGELGSNIEMSLAAYNGGEGRARRVYRENAGRSFWDVDVYNEFPAETKDYVPMVIAAAWLYLHPEEYGLTFPKVDTRMATLKLERPASIYELTICLGNGGTRDGYMRVLRNLNPRYEADQTIAAGTVMNATTKMAGLYKRWCTQGARADLARTLVTSDPSSAIVRTGPVTPVVEPAKTDAEVPVEGVGEPTASRSSGPAKPRVYRVQRGETLTSIASKFECRIGDLADANDVSGPRYMIRPGQRLKLAGCGG